ncbi:hypothetical protein [Maliponia aquimaris]|uniref:Uncharacterized protein n=1 Tax=Maliponia aquimaris TaxID=1673631 RepID=A0A238KV52_9RHOB|nr:hypothetical protein [Maliponia aquimaris]SMX46669.1 hypothetical protein MAA8898_03478 [Maliponia aquimaris]SMX46671.1 hypothetical protein MAA8898_03479 [Maliponia aquimaris]
MKTFIASALIAAATIAGTAQAMTAPSIPSEASAIVPGADFSGLTNAEIHALINIVHGDGSNGDKQAAIRGLLR